MIKFTQGNLVIVLCSTFFVIGPKNSQFLHVLSLCSLYHSKTKTASGKGCVESGPIFLASP